MIELALRGLRIFFIVFSFRLYVDKDLVGVLFCGVMLIALVIISTTREREKKEQERFVELLKTLDEIRKDL